MSKKNTIKDFKPNKDDKYWNKINDNVNIFKYNKQIPETIYEITQQQINKTELIDGYIQEDNILDYNIYKFYKIYDNNHAEICYSKTSIDTTILNYIINHKEDTNKISDFKNLTDVKYKLLECYKVYKNTSIKKEFDIIKNRLREENNIKLPEKSSKQTNTQQNISIIDQYKNYLNKYIDNKQEKHKYYIYKLTDQKNVKQIYIFGTYNKLKKKDIDDLINKYCILFDSGKIKSEIIKEVDIYTELEGLICVDEEIKKNDSIKNGLNRYYNIINDNVFKQGELFMRIQQDKLKNIQKEKIDTGYISSINITDKKYIFSGYNNTKYDKLNYLYHMVKHNEHKYDKIIETLQTTKLEDIKIEILEKNIEQVNLENKLIEYLNYYDKNILLNYNDDYYAKPEDIKKVNSLIFSMKYRK
jgi:hypothetical protein